MRRAVGVAVVGASDRSVAGVVAVTAQIVLVAPSWREAVNVFYMSLLELAKSIDKGKGECRRQLFASIVLHI